MNESEIRKVLRKLMGEDVVDWRLREDGFLIAINQQGWKVTFSPAEVERALQSCTRKRVTANE